VSWLDALFDFLSKFWPFDVVDEWEQGVFLFFGRVVRRGVMKSPLRPGLYVFLPWFSRIVMIDMQPDPVRTPMLQVTLSDGTPLSYSLTAIYRVVNAVDALTKINDYEKSVYELVASKASEKIAAVDAERLTYDKRTRFLSDLLRWMDEDTQQYGIQMMSVRLTNFALGIKAYRFMTDSALSAGFEGEGE